MEESKGLVTLVVSVHNLETLLPRCLAAISAQTYPDLEILLIDDGSTDGSGRVCDEFAATDSRARVIHQENRGVSAARNRGIEEARGECVAFLDGDDYFHKDYIRLLYEAINLGGRQYPLAICDYRRVRDDEEIGESDIEPIFEVLDQTTLMDGIIHYPSCREALWGANWNKLYRKSVFSGPFQKDYLRCQDYDSNLRYFYQVDQAVLVRKVLYYYVVWSGQNTASADDMQIRNDCRCRIFLDHFLTIPERLAGYKPELMANLYRRMIAWKASCRGTSERKAVSRKVGAFEKKTYPYFLTCKQIPLRHKLRWVFSLHAPSLLRLFGKRVTREWA